MPDANTSKLFFRDYLGANYTHNFEACMSATDFLNQIRQTSDLPSNILEAGETPGGKVFKGFVMGQHFSLKKKVFGMSGQYVRELQGRVSEVRIGKKVRTKVEVRLVDSPGVVVTKYTAFVFAGLIGTFILLKAFFFPSFGDSAIWLYMLGALLLVFALYNVGRQMAFRHEEEVLDHVKKIAAGVVPNPDSIMD